MSEYFGKEVPKLGFGLMRLPKKGEEIDIEQVKKMVDLYMDAGFTYFDTAFVYTGSEEATKKALVDRYPRESYTLATKINAFLMATDEKACKEQFFTSLERTGAGYFDYYLLHAFMENNYKKYDEYHIWDFVKEQKQKGLIKYFGFSYHAGPELLDEILTKHSEVDFIQLQINYADWENPAVTSRANYEVARRHGKSIVVMEPVKGGNLANPPKEIQKLMHDYDPTMSYASWAIRFVASLDGILTVLSGMSSVEQMEDNLSYMKNFKPLNDKEQEIIKQAQKIINGFSTIPCTACHYCVDGCPNNIPIPDVFEAMNKQLGEGKRIQAISDYKKAVEGKGKASDCIECKQCEEACPQHLKITEYLVTCKKELEE
ncbi:Fe-S oxidoreductase [Lachnospiraceae bacterium TWA4]|nr:Fe-S oxidoreductase [Lachnospiraceae bacterium TWA4]